jgi:hypothetical protein
MRSLLNTRREREADIREVVVVRHEGLNTIVVKNVGGDTEYRVGVNGRRTFYPGSRVIVASNTGHPGEVVISDSPPASGGASSYTVSPGRYDFPTPTRDTGVPAYHAFFDVGNGTVIASVYDSLGGWVEDRAVAITSPTFTVERFCYIPTDSFAAVGDGSLAYWNGDGTITVLDPSAVSSNTFTGLTAGGWVGLGVGYSGGWLYWLELGPPGLAYHVDHQTVTIRLKKCRTDGTGTAVVATQDYDSTDDFSPQFGKWADTVRGFRITPTAVVGFVEFSDKNPDGTWGLFVDLTFAGVVTRADDTDENLYEQFAWGLAYSGGSFNLGPRAMADTITPTSTAPWASVVWGGNSIDTNATEAMVYSSADGIARGIFSTFGGTPDTVIDIADIARHPTLVALPNCMFLIPA